MSKINIKSWLSNHKDRKKVFHTIFEIVFLVCFTSIVINVVFDFKTYQEEAESKKIYNDGFIAISYFGVDRTQKSTLIDDDMLKEHLNALKSSGYITIDQKDILDYCDYGKKLPKRAMFLSFEDGRRDSALFSQSILEELNYRASMFVYAGKFAERDFKFLQPKDLIKLEKSTFWELGSNGYRFYYINVFDRYGNFLDVLNQDQFKIAEKYIDDDYNHYLMDFIKDEDRVTIETRDEMDKRITWDYNEMERIYSKELQYIPKAYMIMYANGLNGGETNRLVESVNKREIKKLFQLHFNREGESLNGNDSDLLNLTRLQAQPYWYTNHLLMRIGDDTKNEMKFVVGDEKRASKWNVSNGVAEFKKGKIILTSSPGIEAMMSLNNSKDFSDFKLTTSIEGNVIGTQSIYLRYNQEDDTYINVSVKDNILYVNEKTANNYEENIAKYNLRELGKKDIQSVREVILEAEVAKEKIEFQKLEKKEQMDKIKEDTNKNVNEVAIEDAEKEYIPRIGIGQLGKRNLEIVMSEDNLDISVDKISAIKNLKISESSTKGSICLKAMRSEQNIKDDVYDGVFNDLCIEEISKKNENVKFLFDNRITGSEKIWDDITTIYDKIIDWFIENF